MRDNAGTVETAPHRCNSVLSPGTRFAPPAAILADFVGKHRRLFVLTGAGVSTASGIPAYRDTTGAWRRTPPVFLQDFIRSHAARQRYWARSALGWPRIAAARPNAAHRALAELQRAGAVARLVTQNIDGLHGQAGSTDAVELHGNLDRVTCLACGRGFARSRIQHRLEVDNARLVDARARIAPDGDADVDPSLIADFRIPACDECGGLLKPGVVFFGEAVSRALVDDALRSLDESDAMLVAGSSLMVYSGYRFCEAARAMGKPIAAINLGRTRADALLELKVEQPCADALAGLVELLRQRRVSFR